MKPSLITRIGFALDAAKTAMQFPQSSMGGGGVRPASGFYSWADGFQTRGTQIKYAREVGDLTQSSLVMAAVNYGGRRLPEAPIKVYDEDEDEKLTVIKKHPLSELIRRPNPFYSGATLMKSFALNWIIDGNVYWRKVLNKRGNIIQLWPIPYWMITPYWDNRDASSYINNYRYRVNSSTEDIPPEEIVHFRDGEDPNNSRKGLSPVRALLREIYSDIEVANFAAVLMKNGGIPDFILSPKEGSFTQVEQDALAQNFQRQRTGDERGKAIGISRAVAVERLTFEPDKLDLSKMRTIPETRLASVIGIPGVILGFQMDKAGKYKNMEEAADQATEGFLKPLWDYIDAELTHQLLPDFDGEASSRIVKHDLSNVQALQEDRNEFSLRISTEYEKGIIKRKEAREKLGYDFDEVVDNVYASETKPAPAPFVQDPFQLNPVPDVVKALIGDGKPDKYELAGMRSNWLRHGKRPSLYLRGVAGNGSRQSPN